MDIKEIHIGDIFGRLKVIKKDKSHIEKSGKVRSKWLCICSCGNKVSVLGTNLRKGNTMSCGCLWKEVSQKIKTKHGLRNTRLYGIWSGIRKRTLNENCKDYKNYGGRGIYICKEWLDDFKAFYEWAISNGYKNNLTIERINVNGNYEPNNCKWATHKEQSQNTRRTNIITFNWETHCASEWERILGYNAGLIYSRQHLGWPLSKIMTKPSRQTKKTIKSS